MLLYCDMCDIILYSTFSVRACLLHLLINEGICEVQSHVIARCWKMTGEGILRSSSADELRLLPCSYLSTVGGLLLFDRQHSKHLVAGCLQCAQTHRVNQISRKVGRKIMSTLTVFKNKSVASALLWVSVFRRPHLPVLGGRLACSMRGTSPTCRGVLQLLPHPGARPIFHCSFL